MTTGTRLALRWLIYLAAAAVIALALLVGVVRLLLPQVPEYQDDIRAWASTATGYDIRFGSISASWPLSGPQLSFYDVSLTRPGETAAVLSARELSAGLSVMRLLRDGRPSLAHIAVTGTRINVEHTPAGEFHVQGRRIEDLLPQRQHPPELDLELNDIAITYLDPRREPRSIALSLDHMEGALHDERFTAEALLKPPARFGSEILFKVEMPLPLPSPLALPAAWDVRLSGSELDLPNVLRYANGDAGIVRAAKGDGMLALRVRDGRTTRVAVEVDLHDVAFGAGAETTAFQGFAGALVWSQSAAGWDADLSGLKVRRGAGDSPATSAELHYRTSGETTPEQWSGRADFIRLDDVFPLVVAALAGTEAEAKLPRLARGDLHNLEAEFAAQAEEPPRYSLRLGFERLGVTSATGEVSLAGLTGTIAADGDGGRLQLDSRDAGLYLGQWFRDTLQAQTLKGLLIWRAGSDGVRLLSDDVTLKSPTIDVRSRLELAFPPGPGSPIMDLKATLSATQAREALRYLPLRSFPPKVVDWLERAVVGGTVPQATVEFRGPLREFPYDHGEGTFRVALDLRGATLDYADNWPRIEGIDADVVFDGVSMYSTRNRARVAGVSSQNYAVRIPDLRRGVLALSGGQRVGVEELLNFIRATPVADAIGRPTLDRVAGTGAVDATLRLALPLTHLTDYDLKVLFDTRGCQLGLQRLPMDLTDLRGRILLENTRFSGTGLRAVMLGEPVEISLRSETAPDSTVTHVAEFTGNTPVAKVTSTFNLPFREYLDGRAQWRATARIPGRRQDAAPLSVSIQSDLRGVTSTLPPPVAKAPDASWPATFDLTFPAGDFIDVTGHMEPPLAWALRLVQANGAWRIERGAVRAGPGDARLPQRRGMELTGRVEQLRLTDWIATGTGGDGRALRETWRDLSLQIGRLIVAGQVFPDVDATARRDAESWAVTVKGPRAEGLVTVPFDTAARPLALDMKRLWLLESEKGEGRATDPRTVMAADVKAEDVALGAWRFGTLDMSVAKTADGLVARRIATKARSFDVNGEGDWTVEGGDPARQHTHLKAKLHGSDARETLEQLGFGPVISGKEIAASVDLSWPGAPSEDFLAASSGQIGVELKNGQVLELEPGSGRLLGLLSVTALPRRLALDFSDVLNQGLAFDSIKGNFRVASGNAYTCNLGLTGPVADIGIVGRTAFAERTYDQLAVVRPQVSNVLTVGGVVLGGPVGGATMLLISQLFRKPLSTLGESYYHVSGNWDQPEVLRVQRSEVDTVPYKDCEKEVNAALEAATATAPPVPAATTAPADPR
jgi:uncharacterized protein (TIGR02099 family)